MKMIQSLSYPHQAVDNSKPVFDPPVNKFITSLPFDIMEIIRGASSPEAGGIVLFIGDVRNHNLGKKVKYLVYEAFIPLAEKSIEEIVNSAIKIWNLSYAAAIHRIGKLEISESAVAVVTAHSHRKEAYDANQYIINRIKHESPVWKCEYYQDGTYKWGDNCNSSEAILTSELSQ